MKKSSISRFNNNLSTMFIVDESNNEIKAYELEPEYKELTGGGSSDLTTAKLTVTTSEHVAITAPMTILMGDTGASTTEIDFSSDSELDIILYKGTALLFIVPTGTATVGTISGDITSAGDGRYVMTGDASVEIVGGSD